MLTCLADNADAFGEAIEAKDLERPLKQCSFRTRNGRVYRAIYLIEEERVFVLRVRGPGQANLQQDEI